MTDSQPVHSAARLQAGANVTWSVRVHGILPSFATSVKNRQLGYKGAFGMGNMMVQCMYQANKSKIQVSSPNKKFKLTQVGTGPPALRKANLSDIWFYFIDTAPGRTAAHHRLVVSPARARC